MAATFTKLPDGDLNLGNLNGEIVTMQVAAADYVAGGYAVVDGVSVVNSGGTLQANCDLYRVVGIFFLGGFGGYRPVFNPATKKVQVLQGAAAAGPDTEVAAGTDLSGSTLQLMLIGL